MPRRSGYVRIPKQTPKNAVEGSAWMRRYLLDMYDQRDGEAADWQLIAETAFKVGLDAIDKAASSQRRSHMLNRLHAAAYDRLSDGLHKLTTPSRAITSE